MDNADLFRLDSLHSLSPASGSPLREYRSGPSVYTETRRYYCSIFYVDTKITFVLLLRPVNN